MWSWPRLSFTFTHSATSIPRHHAQPGEVYRSDEVIGQSVLSMFTDQDDILKSADAAMYRAKDGGRNTNRVR